MPLSPGASVGRKEKPALAMTPVGVALGSSHGIAAVKVRKRERKGRMNRVANFGR